jgi:hypothetical protein
MEGNMTTAGILTKTFRDGQSVIKLGLREGENPEVYDTYRPGSDGDKFWERSWDIAESVVRCRLYDQKTKESELRCGLELLRAKINLGHGGWKPYLLRVGMSPTTAWRRMKMASRFLGWSKIKSAKVKRPQERHITKAMESLNSEGKYFKMKDFLSYLEECALYEFPVKLRATHGRKGWKNPFDCDGLMKRVISKIRKKISREYMGWSPEGQAEAMDFFVSSIQFLLIEKHNLEKITPNIKPTMEATVGNCEIHNL